MNKEERSKILLVDDAPINLEILNESLKDDYEVISCDNGPDAVHLALTASQPDILLDIMMPGMSGYEVCQKLKDDPQTTDIPIIFLTALAEEENEERGLSLGAIDYITKPFSIPIVKARVKTQLDLKSSRDRLVRKSAQLADTNIQLEKEVIERKKIEEMLREHINFLQDIVKSNSFVAASRDAGSQLDE